MESNHKTDFVMSFLYPVNIADIACDPIFLKSWGFLHLLATKLLHFLWP